VTSSDAQESLLGCGTGFGTQCDSQGISLFRAAPWALFQSFGTGPTNDATTPQPGTASAPVPPGVPFPGARGLADAGYVLAVDGSTLGLAHPLAAPQTFRSESAALSWNFERLLVAFSSPDADGVIEPQELDAAHVFRTDGCSYVRPDLCSAVMSNRHLAVTPLGDDPNGGPPLQWLWEIGAAFDVTSATGDLCRYAGGTVLVSGPYAEAGPSTGFSFLVLPSEAADLDCDGVPDDGDGSGIAGDAPCTGGATTGCDDNCRFRPNPTQSDVGGVGSGSAPDGIGDACQCGDQNGDGRVTAVDAVLLTRSFLSPPTATRDDALCDVGFPAGCSISDAVLIRRALLQPATAMLSQTCPATRS
jgi:hypothetical protein